MNDEAKGRPGMRHLGSVTAGFAVLALAACSNMANVPPPTTTQVSGQAPGATAPGTITSTPSEGQIVTVRARITGLNSATRHVTLLGPNNETITVAAGPEVVNFPQLRIGDTVTLRFYRSTAFVLSEP